MVQRFGVPAQGEDGLQRKGRPDRQPHQQRRPAAEHQRRAHEHGQQRQQPRRPDDRGGADQAGRRTHGDGDQPGRDDAQPGIGDHARVTSRHAPNFLHAPTVAPGRAMRIRRGSTWIQTCD
jgi:hypothetical protein